MREAAVGGTVAGDYILFGRLSQSTCFERETLYSPEPDRSRDFAVSLWSVSRTFFESENSCGLYKDEEMIQLDEEPWSSMMRFSDGMG